jgi:hypothetical protein
MVDAGRDAVAPETLRAVMDAAWRDHHHARDQTWRGLQIEGALAAGMLTVDAQFRVPFATTAIGVLVVVASFFGIMITLNHRRLERRKFIHIMNCEEMLGVHRDDLIPLDSKGRQQFGISHDGYEARCPSPPPRMVVKAAEVSVPGALSFVDALNPNVNNTAVFIVRMHIAIMLFAVILVIARLLVGRGVLDGV